MKLFFIPAAIFLLSQISSAQTGIAATATFGRHSDCASGRGACSLTLSKSETGQLARRSSANTLVLEIKNESLTIDDQLHIAGKRFSELKDGQSLVFVQQEPIFIDSTSLENLNLDQRTRWIAAGNYSMQITKDKTAIVFTLKNAN